MNNYVFKLVRNGNLHTEGFGNGRSAMEAFEEAVKNGTIYIPEGDEVEVLALNDSGLGIRFSAIKGI